MLAAGQPPACSDLGARCSLGSHTAVQGRDGHCTALAHMLLGWAAASKPRAVNVVSSDPYGADWLPRWAHRVISRRANPLDLSCSRQCHSRPTMPACSPAPLPLQSRLRQRACYWLDRLSYLEFTSWDSLWGLCHHLFLQGAAAPRPQAHTALQSWWQADEHANCVVAPCADEWMTHWVLLGLMQGAGEV